MMPGPMTGVLHHIRELAGATDRDGQSDAELLERFTARRDEAAFAALVRRHGPMVLGVCRRLLGNEADAEDAFQATFLILVRKAAGIGRPAALGCWLYEVALRTARRARARATTRRAYERRVPRMPQHDFTAAVAWRDLQPVLDAEIGRLPAGYREPFVLCCLQGQTYAQAAKQLGCPRGTVWRRLAAARELLRRRLTRRGLDLPAGVLAAALAQGQASASVSARLVAATTGAAVGAAGYAVPAAVAALVRGRLGATVSAKAKAVLGIVLALGATWAGAGLLASDTQAPQAAQAGVQAGRAAAAATRRPTVRVCGRLLDQAGIPVPEALLVLVPLAPDSSWEGPAPVVQVKGGRFEARECEAGATYAVLVVDAGWRRGGVGQLTARAGDIGALTVPLHDTGCVRARVIEGPGKPAGSRYPLQVWVKGFGKEGPSAERGVRLPNPFVDTVTTNGAGWIALDGLIPGVTYALTAFGREVCEFEPEPGKKSELGDILVLAR
jgi:RNA polymerase sigma factor (sigma-70 family)